MEDFKKSILDYSFYDDQHRLIVILNENKLNSTLKELFQADEIKFKEEY